MLKGDYEVRCQHSVSDTLHSTSADTFWLGRDDYNILRRTQGRLEKISAVIEHRLYVFVAIVELFLSDYTDLLLNKILVRQDFHQKLHHLHEVFQKQDE